MKNTYKKKVRVPATQKVMGLLMILIGVIMPMIDNGNITSCFLTIPMGLGLLLAKKRVID